MVDYITSPDSETKIFSDGISDVRFGCYQDQNRKFTQEDALTFKVLDTYSNIAQLTPQEIGQYLWTSYKELNQAIQKEAETNTIQYAHSSGTTANTTVYDGKGNLITANLADSAAFAVIYDKEDNIVGVKRLNSTVHNVSSQEEKERLALIPGATIEKSAFGDMKLNGSLSVTRALGDFGHVDKGLSADAKIDIHSIENIAREYNLAPADVGKVQVISVSDGYTEATKSDDKTVHEHYLQNALKALANEPMDEKTLAQQLAKHALKNNIADNITVSVTTITQGSPAFLQGVYDGHGTAQVAQYTAQNICDVFEKIYTLSPDEYKTQKNSTYKNIESYSRDNDPATYVVLKNIDSQIKNMHERALILEEHDHSACSVLHEAYTQLKEEKSRFLQGETDLQQVASQCNSIVNTVNSNPEVKKQSNNLFFKEFDTHLNDLTSKMENLKARGEVKAAEVIFDVRNKLSIEKIDYVDGLSDSEQFSTNCEKIIDYARNHQDIKEHRNLFSRIFEGIKSLINKLVPGLCEPKITDTVEKVQSMKGAIQDIKNSTYNPQEPVVPLQEPNETVNEEQPKFSP